MTTLELNAQPSRVAQLFGPQDANARSSRPFRDLFLISFLILFFELACIRWFGSMVVFLTFFTNVILIACFLGMSVGCLASSSRKRDLVSSVLPLTALAVVLAWAAFNAYHVFAQQLTIDVGNQASPQNIYFGTEYRPKDPSRVVIPMELIAGTFFALVALIFVGLGQVLGRSLEAVPNRIGAYTINVVGSLAGIIAFFVVSKLHLPPHFWFAAAVMLCLYFVPRWTPLQIVAQLVILYVIAVTSYGAGEHGHVEWSPYYKIRHDYRKAEIDTNNISHQYMTRTAQSAPAYSLPHLLNRDAGNGPFNRAMIIGAGSGNDVAAALASGVRHVDAVEIDPVIHQIGSDFHPEKPYDDPRVAIHLEDGRQFLKSTPHKYDLVQYALVDSLVLHSSYSSLRLESFLFTKQAFEDVKSRLDEGGVFVMYNFYRQGWVVGRLARMARDVFGVEPIVISMPYQQRIAPEDAQDGAITMLLVSNGASPRLESIRKRFEETGTFWIYDRPDRSCEVNGFATQQPALQSTLPTLWQKIAPAKVETAGIGMLPTDNWPFLYLREAKIPSLSWRGIIMIGVISLVILFSFAPVRKIKPNWHMFFLGAGFMLLETKGVVHMALLFGSTWVVNSVVFFAILVMILLGNCFVAAVKPRSLTPYYLGLVAALLVNSFVSMQSFLELPGIWKTFVSCGVIFVPIFFAAVIFATSFRDSRSADVDFGSNIAGVILGGLSENLSMVLGFNHLLLVAVVFYLLSLVLKPRLRLSVPTTS